MSEQRPEPDQPEATDTTQEPPKADEHTETPHPPGEVDGTGDDPPLPRVWH